MHDDAMYMCKQKFFLFRKSHLHSFSENKNKSKLQNIFANLSFKIGRNLFLFSRKNYRRYSVHV